MEQRRAIRLCLGLRARPPLWLPTEAGTWTIQMRALPTGLHHIYLLYSAPEGAALMQR